MTASTAVPVEECAVLSIADLLRQRYLVPGATSHGILFLTRADPPWLSIDFLADLTDPDEAWLRLIYTTRGQRVDQRVNLTATQPRYGGLRWWFACPNADGGRHHVAKLYLPPQGDRFGSRQDHRLTYQCCQQSAGMRKLLKAVREDREQRRLLASLFQRTPLGPKC